MLERETSGYTPKVEVNFSLAQDTPFAVVKEGNKWQLSVNRTHLEARGFSPDEIDGATYLEEELLNRQTAVSSKATVEGLRRWKDVASGNPQATTFKTAFERLSALSSLEDKDFEKAKKGRRYLERFAGRSVGADYVDQLFSQILRVSLGQEATSEIAIVQTVLNNLQKPEQIEGRVVSSLEALCSPDLSPSAKASWFENRFLPRLNFLENQDRQRKEKEIVQPEEVPEETESVAKTPPTPPPAEDEYEQHRGREEKGKGQPMFIIDPSYTGYWETDSYDSIDESSGRLRKSDILRIKTVVSNASGTVLDGTRRILNGQSGTNLFGLPLAPKFVPTQEGLGALRNKGIEVYTDAEGHFFLKSPQDSPIQVEVGMTTQSATVVRTEDKNTSEILPDEVENELNRIGSFSTDSLTKIQAWQDYIRDNFKYPDDSQVESMYATVDNNPSGRLKTLTDGKLLDCYLAREYFIAGLKRLNLTDTTWRGVNGHFISSAQKDGTAHIHAGTGHAWAKVKVDGQNSWIIFDPTPPGDPIHQGEGAIDEFGELSPTQLSEENLQELEKDAERAELKDQNKVTQDQYLWQFAKEAGIPEDEAREILTTVSKVDQLTDKQGRGLLARLQEQFNRIIQEYTSSRLESQGLVKMSRGRGLREPVETLLDLRAGNLDPTGFERKRLVEEKEQFYGGWDLEIIADGSGSMSESLGGRVKYVVQREMSYLLHKALHRFSQDAQRRKLRLVTPLKIRSSQYIFRGNKIEEIKPLSDEFNPTQMTSLWKKSAENIGGGTPAHLGLQAVLDRIPPEDVQLLKDKKLLKVVALISDGGYDNTGLVRNMITRLQEINVVVAEFTIADAKSLEELPQNVAESVIEAARLLMPERVKRE